jgi:hypothetical protein
MTGERQSLSTLSLYRDVQIHETFGGQQVQHNVQQISINLVKWF